MLELVGRVYDAYDRNKNIKTFDNLNLIDLSLPDVNNLELCNPVFCTISS